MKYKVMASTLLLKGQVKIHEKYTLIVKVFLK